MNRAATYCIDTCDHYVSNARRQKQHDLAQEECKEEAVARVSVSSLEGLPLLPCERRPLSFRALCSNGVPNLEPSLLAFRSPAISAGSSRSRTPCPSPAEEYFRFQIRSGSVGSGQCSWLCRAFSADKPAAALNSAAVEDISLSKERLRHLECRYQPPQSRRALAASCGTDSAATPAVARLAALVASHLLLLLPLPPRPLSSSPHSVSPVLLLAWVL